MSDQDLRDHLYQRGVEGILYTLSLKDFTISRWLIDKLVGKFLGNVIEVALEFDRQIADVSLQGACTWLAEVCGEPVQVHQPPNIPDAGPVLIVANHPGFYEAMVILSQLPRDDIKVVVGGIPYFNQLPNTSAYTIYTDRSTKDGVRVLRESIRHLRAGGVLLIFPTGHVDPDPDVMTGAFDRFSNWSESIALLMRRVQESLLVPTIISGIFSPKIFNHPIVRMQKKFLIRRNLTEIIQIFRQFNDLNRKPYGKPRLTFGEPVRFDELVKEPGGRAIMPAILDLEASLYRTHMDMQHS